MASNLGQYNMPEEAIVLAGGFGTRLKSVIKEVPKPMAPINDVPFLEYLLVSLLKQGIKRCILALGYLHEQIETYFGTTFQGMDIVYALEKDPLGTGGGVQNALQYANSKTLFLLNGDTFFDVNLKDLSTIHAKENAAVTFSLKPMEKFDRYGSVEVIKDRIVRFNEKKYMEKGLINGGVYCIEKNIFESVGLKGKFSLEQDYFEPNCAKKHFAYSVFDAYFIDIGIPEDYVKAQVELPDIS